MIMWIVIGLFAVMSLIFLLGKGSFLIAGYNTSSPEQKKQYDEVKLCRVMGIGMLVMTLSMLIGVFFEDFASYAIIGGIVLGTIIIFVGESTYAKKDEYEFIPKVEKEKKEWYKNPRFYSITFTGVVLVVVGFMMFTGSVSIEFGKNEMMVDAFMTSPITLKYKDIEEVEYKKNIDVGSRTWGVGSAKLVAGRFKNKEYGSYKLYAYTNCKTYVVLTTKDEYIVLNDEDDEKTKLLYSQVKEYVQ